MDRNCPNWKASRDASSEVDRGAEDSELTVQLEVDQHVGETVAKGSEILVSTGRSRIRW